MEVWRQNLKQRTKDMRADTPWFFRQVYEVVRKVPRGRVTTYGAIARYLSAGSARAVGWALHKSGLADVPAHRVVNRKGELSGRLHFGSPTLMQELLEQEGVKVEANRVVAFERLFWDPSTELGCASV